MSGRDDQWRCLRCGVVCNWWQVCAACDEADRREVDAQRLARELRRLRDNARPEPGEGERDG